MNKFRLGLIFCFGLILTNGLCQDFGLKPKYSVSFDIEKGSRLLKQCSRGTPDNISSYWTVTADEIKVLEDNFKKIKKIKIIGLLLSWDSNWESEQIWFPVYRFDNWQ
jgi:hypothetical protein